jgi:hypothetical protein
LKEKENYKKQEKDRKRKEAAALIKAKELEKHKATLTSKTAD